MSQTTVFSMVAIVEFMAVGINVVIAALQGVRHNWVPMSTSILFAGVWLGAGIVLLKMREAAKRTP